MSLKEKIYLILKGIDYEDLTQAEKQILKLVKPDMDVVVDVVKNIN